MSKNKRLDIVLALIDENIREEHSEICRKIYAETGYCDQDYNKFLSVSTAGEMTLKDYIRKRKLFFAAREIVDQPNKSITGIASDYGYESSSLARALKQEYKKTPTEIRKDKIRVSDNRFNADEFLSINSRLDAVMEKVARDGTDVSWTDWDYFEAFIKATDEYGFDVSTCCLISELSEKLGIPFPLLLDKCFDMMIDHLPPEGELPEKYEYIIDVGIYNDEELNAVLRYYNCEYYELTKEKVAAFKAKYNK